MVGRKALAKLQDQGSPEADHELTDIELNTIAHSDRKITDVSTGDNEQASSHEPPRIQNEKSEREKDTIIYV